MSTPAIKTARSVATRIWRAGRIGRVAGLGAALALLVSLAPSMSAQAGMDLVTVPDRQSVQVTIYNEADLTLVRERRPLTLKLGENHLQFSWAGTLIDPTSLELMPTANGDAITVQNLVFPPRTTGLGRWNMASTRAGANPFEITYFTSGMSWRAFYMGTLAADEKSMRLEGYVTVTNQTGEDFTNAQTRLVVGKTQLLDDIATLAQRQTAYGSPRGDVQWSSAPAGAAGDADFAGPMDRDEAAGKDYAKKALRLAGNRKEIAKEGLSEYFLYTIEGQESIANGWSKRLPSFDTADIPVVNLYKYDEGRYGADQVVRFLSYKNDKEHKLGVTPIPGGTLRVYRQVNAARNLGYEGVSTFKYIPVGEDVELNLGAVENVIVEPILMRTATEAFALNRNRDLVGWDEVQEWQVEVRNTRDVPVKVEVSRDLQHAYWNQAHTGDFGTYEKIDLDTIRFTLDVPPRSTQTFSYTVTYHEGTNRQ